jgi:hypothetical protein
MTRSAKNPVRLRRAMVVMMSQVSRHATVPADSTSDLVSHLKQKQSPRRTTDRPTLSVEEPRLVRQRP